MKLSKIRIPEKYVINNIIILCSQSLSELSLLKHHINYLGKKSSKSQKLHTVITSFNKAICDNSILFLYKKENEIVGLLKIGRKNLFVNDNAGEFIELNDTLCVLDFYVDLKYQRQGIGYELFKQMMEYVEEKYNLGVKDLAFDRPSEKLMAFLKKYFGLCEYVPQNNNFVIFNQASIFNK